MKTFGYGSTTSLECRVVALCWDAARVGDDPDRSILERVKREPGVYAIEGNRDGAPSPGILYVGRTGHGDSKNVLATRVEDSLERVWWENDKGTLRMYSDVWDVQVRWAPIADQSMIEAVERVLIVGHRPPFNAQLVQAAIPLKWSDILVLNAGKKGRLQPMVFGGYFTPSLFDHY